jgi:hypothetical protein
MSNFIDSVARAIARMRFGDERGWELFRRHAETAVDTHDTAIATFLREYADEVAEYHSVAPGFLRNAADMIAAGEYRK